MEGGDCVNISVDAEVLEDGRDYFGNIRVACRFGVYTIPAKDVVGEKVATLKERL